MLPQLSCVPEELPKIKEVIAEQLVEPTAMKNLLGNENSTSEEAGDANAYVVTEGGELIGNNDQSDSAES